VSRRTRTDREQGVCCLRAEGPEGGSRGRADTPLAAAQGNAATREGGLSTGPHGRCAGPEPRTRLDAARWHRSTKTTRRGPPCDLTRVAPQPVDRGEADHLDPALMTAPGSTAPIGHARNVGAVTVPPKRTAIDLDERSPESASTRSAADFLQTGPAPWESAAFRAGNGRRRPRRQSGGVRMATGLPEHNRSSGKAGLKKCAPEKLLIEGFPERKKVELERPQFDKQQVEGPELFQPHRTTRRPAVAD
jgi:hypothetical protein